MEVDILKALKFEILVASATGFSDYIQRAIVDHEETRQLIDVWPFEISLASCLFFSTVLVVLTRRDFQFLCDLSLISHHFLEFNTCQIAAAVSACYMSYTYHRTAG